MLPMSFYDNLVNGGYHDNLFGAHEEDSEPIIIDAHNSLEDDRREKRDANDRLGNFSHALAQFLFSNLV